ncbi:EF-Tu/IF-2/RF-3 family GTPase, partial [Campylobacter coli]
VRIYEGSIAKNDEVLVMSTDKKHIVQDLFYPHPLSPIKTQSLQSGEVGVVVLGLKTVGDVQVGDTITLVKNKAKEAIGGFEKAKAFVFAGLYPIETDKFE